MLRVVQDEAERAEFAEVLDEIVRDGARRMLAAALESEVEAYVTAAKAERDGKGHALVTRNGKAWNVPSSPVPVRSRSGLRGSTTEGQTNKASASASRATSCLPTLAGRPR